MKVAIIGGGPAGSYAAYLLARRGHKVKVFEEHDIIGKPVQCTGLFTGSVENILPMRKEFVVNRIKRAKVMAGDKEIEFRLRRDNIIVDRERFDKFLADKAMKEGVEFFFGSKFSGCKAKDKIRFKANGKEYETDFLVGADGAFSNVSKVMNKEKVKYVTGLQARVNLEHDKELIEFYLDTGMFGWLVPESGETARIGVIAYDNINEHFRALLKRFERIKVIEYQSGLVPVYDPGINSQKGNVFLVGDAATHVKATSFGGVIYGLMGAEELCRAVSENKDYNRLWRKRFGRELWLSLFSRKILDKFSLKDYEDLIELLNKGKAKELLENHDRDFPSKFLFKLALREPRLLLFLRKLF
ncbi:hypothetical protein CMO89_02700 [Candidatus Woesearchaeota archaeon]|nr:hypothetical protein [Candidatus Woesearchaeota archaeon]|tara:strand:- start:11537 stop:12607 length:1071 start_codon:yes stop_codon:yes gene_type:complete